MSQTRVDTRPLRGNPIITGRDTVAPGLNYRRPQGLDDPVLVYTFAGQGFMGPEGRKLEQLPGRITIVDPHRPLDQDVLPPRPWHRIWTIFAPRAHWYGWMDWPQPLPGCRVLDIPPGSLRAQVHSCLNVMHGHAVSGVRSGPALAMNALEQALILAGEAGPGVDSRQDPRLARALAFIGQGIGKRLTLQAIAAAAHVSAPHLSRLFRARLGQSVMAYVEHQRITRACQLLEMTSGPINQIAREVGFEDPFYFATRFRKAMKTSPGVFRKTRMSADNRPVKR